MIDAVNLRDTRTNSGGQDHFFETSVDDRLGIHLLAELQIDAAQFKLLAKITKRLVELLFTGDLLGKVELTPNFAGSVKQGDVKAASRCRGRKRQPSWAGTHHSHALFRARRRFDHQRLVAGTRVHQAGRDLAAKGVVQTGLVAANAGIDFISLARSRLVHKVWVGEEGPRHRHHIGHAIGQHLFSHLRRVDAVGGDERNPHFALELLCHPRKGGAWHLGCNGRNARLVPANARVQNRYPGRLERLCQLHHFGQGGTPFDQVEHGQAKDQNEIGPDLGSSTPDNFQRETDAVFITAAPSVITVIGVRGDELVDQVSLGSHDFHAVIAGTLGQRCRSHKIFNRLLHLFGAERVRTKRVDRRFDRARCDQVGVVGVAPKVQNLHTDLATRIMNGLGHDFVLLRLFRRGHSGAAGHGAGTVVRGDTTGHNQCDTATRPLGIERGHALEAVLGLFEPNMHRAHQHPIFQSCEAQIQRAEHQRVGGHRKPHKNRISLSRLVRRCTESGLSCGCRRHTDRWATLRQPACNIEARPDS